jgi:predicted transcriptional regulator
MYAANLSWPSVQKTLNTLMSKGYIIELSGSTTYSKKQYKITEAGRNVLSYYDKLEKLVNVDIRT